jgi:hypothetical protein
MRASRRSSAPARLARRACIPKTVERTSRRGRRCVQAGAWTSSIASGRRTAVSHAILARGAPVRNARGSIVAWAGINLDIDR